MSTPWNCLRDYLQCFNHSRPPHIDVDVPCCRRCLGLLTGVILRVRCARVCPILALGWPRCAFCTFTCGSTASAKCPDCARITGNPDRTRACRRTILLRFIYFDVESAYRISGSAGSQLVAKHRSFLNKGQTPRSLFPFSFLHLTPVSFEKYSRKFSHLVRAPSPTPRYSKRYLCALMEHRSLRF